MEAAKRYRELAARAEDPERRADYLAAVEASNESAKRNFRESIREVRRVARLKQNHKKR